jgi:hypothetical protein
MEIKDLVKNRYVEFAFYRGGFFHYNIIVVNSLENGMSTREIYQFHIPLEDVGNATLPLRDKAITYMRYIRKAIEDKTLIKIQ